MNKIRILQIGDIHYPWARNHKSAADFGSSPDNISNVTEHIVAQGAALNKIAGQIRTICEEPPDVIAFVGDYTVKGEPLALAEAVEYCKKAIISPFFSETEYADHVIFVPGNHDVARPTPGSTDPYKKFEAYQTALENAGVVNHSTKNFGRASVSTAHGVVRVLGVNTCVGCGEFRALPAKLANDFVTLISGFTDKDGHGFDPVLLGGIAEQLDIPFLDRSDIDNLDLELSARSGSRVAAVIGHHNLLPQKETRVLAYGELLNSGVLRETLTNKSHPLIYLHGHIHSEPVELIRDPSIPEGGLLAISAPLITDGVNVVDIYYDEDLDVVGVEVIPWRFSPTMSLQHKRSLKIPLGQAGNRLSRLPSAARDIFAYLVQAGDAAQRHLTKISAELNIDVEAASRHCSELAWAGLVEINNYHKAKNKWDVRLAI